MNMTFKEFLVTEAVEAKVDVEDLDANELAARAADLKKIAKLKAAGKTEQANRISIRNLQQQLRTTTDSKSRADIQRRIRELRTPTKQPSGV